MTSYDSNNIFAQILKGILPSKKLHETNYTLAIHDINPLSNFHIVCIPKLPSINIVDFKSKAIKENLVYKNDLITLILKIIKEIENNPELDSSNILILSNAGIGPFFTQCIFHTHIHIIAPWKVQKNRNILINFKKLDKNALEVCFEKLPNLKIPFNFQIFKNDHVWEYSVDIDEKNL